MLDIDLAVSIKRLSVAFVPLMLGIILHEVAHGWAALKRYRFNKCNITVHTTAK